jgi:hypothetical protein
MDYHSSIAAIVIPNCSQGISLTRPCSQTTTGFREKFLAYLKEAREKGELAFPGNIAHLKEGQSFNAMLQDLYDRYVVTDIIDKLCLRILSGVSVDEMTERIILAAKSS